MEFRQFKALIQSNFAAMTANVNHLFEVSVGETEEQVAAFKDQLWNLYLDSFPVGTNKFFRERREYDCSCCRHWVRTIGNAVVIEDGKIRTVWDLQTGDEKFQPVADALAAFIKSHAISDLYVTKEKKIGIDYNYEGSGADAHKWEHFYLELPSKFVNPRRDSEATIKGEFRSGRSVFKRGLAELTEDSILTVLELIGQKSLYKGEEWGPVLKEFLKLKKAYDKLATEQEKDIFAWDQFMKVSRGISLLRNHSMGTLLVDISEGKELDAAVRSFEKIVAPANYKRPKAVFTQKMLDDAKQTITDLGYLNSLGRQHAVLDDISINNVIFSNQDAAQRIAGGDVFAEMSAEIPTNPKKFDKVEEISIETFLNSVITTATSLEVFLENGHAANAVSLIAPQDKTAPSMFKWPNGFSWAYAGNVTDSDVKQNVKAAGGDVEGILRFSIQWNDLDGHDGNDLDAHCIEPGVAGRPGYHIYFGNKRELSPTGGMLDIDIISPKRDTPAVENITWKNTSKMKEGVYKFYVNNYNNNGGRGGFRAEIEIEGQIYSFDYGKEVKQNENVQVAEVTYSKANGFSIVEKLPSSVSSRDIWGLQTNQFVPVSVVMFSPNYWDEQEGIGHKHYFFMLKDCINPEQPNGFYNEFLKQELDQHKRVFEALGSKMAVKYVDDQLSGLGFSSTKRSNVLVKVKGQTERVVKVLF